MTPLQEAYLNKIRMTASANMEFFKKNLPALHEKLAADGPSAAVDISDQGDITVRFDDGTTLSVAEHFKLMEQRLQEFQDIDIRPQLVGFHNFRQVAQGEAGHGHMQRYHYSNLDADFPNRVKQHFNEHYPDQTGLLKHPEFGSKSIPILIVVGGGCGWHLNRLMMEYDIRHMFVVDTDIDAFRLSTFFQDYVQLSRLAIEKGTSLSFTVEPDVASLTQNIVHLVQQSLPPCFVHGAGVFYAIEDQEVLAVLKKSLPVTLWQLFFGLGYFDDEFISIKHSFENIRNAVPVYTKSRVVDEDAIVFIIGSGPSLDGLMPLLKEHQDRAVLFSCGTALGALSHAGLRPDFHFEKERPFLAHEILVETVGEDYLREVNFIGVNVIYPPVFKLFKTGGMVLKSTDTVADLLRQDGDEILLDVQPTVTNAALNVAISMGFRKIYLAGVDLGYADTTQHHSKHTIYHDIMPKDGPLQKLFSRNKKRDQLAVEGNFGGLVHTTNILNVARITMERSVVNRPGTQVFNMNHGARVEGTIPLHGEDFHCEVGSSAKPGTLEAILGAFEVRNYDTGRLGAELLRQVDAFIDEIGVLLNRPLTSKKDALDRMEEIYQVIFSVRHVGKPVNTLFRGSLLHIMAYSYQMLSIIADEGEAAAKVQTDFGIMIELMRKARAEIEREIGQV